MLQGRIRQIREGVTGKTSAEGITPLRRIPKCSVTQVLTDNVLKFYPENAPYKALSPVMIMLSTAQEMRKVDKEKYSPIADEMLNELLYGGYLKEDVLPENVALDGKFADTPTGRTVNPGYSLETSWFLMEEKSRRLRSSGI